MSAPWSASCRVWGPYDTDTETVRRMDRFVGFCGSLKPTPKPKSNLKALAQQFWLLLMLKRLQRRVLAWKRKKRKACLLFEKMRRCVLLMEAFRLWQALPSRPVRIVSPRNFDIAEFALRRLLKAAWEAWREYMAKRQARKDLLAVSKLYQYWTRHASAHELLSRAFSEWRAVRKRRIAMERLANCLKGAWMEAQRAALQRWYYAVFGRYTSVTRDESSTHRLRYPCRCVSRVCRYGCATDERMEKGKDRRWRSANHCPSLHHLALRLENAAATLDELEEETSGGRVKHNRRYTFHYDAEELSHTRKVLLRRSEKRAPVRRKEEAVKTSTVGGRIRRDAPLRASMDRWTGPVTIHTTSSSVVAEESPIKALPLPKKKKRGKPRPRKSRKKV